MRPVGAGSRRAGPGWSSSTCRSRSRCWPGCTAYRSCAWSLPGDGATTRRTCSGYGVADRLVAPWPRGRDRPQLPRPWPTPLPGGVRPRRARVSRFPGGAGPRPGRDRVRRACSGPAARRLTARRRLDAARGGHLGVDRSTAPPAAGSRTLASCATPTSSSPTPGRTRSPRSPPPAARPSSCPQHRPFDEQAPPRGAAPRAWLALVPTALPGPAGPACSTGARARRRGAGPLVRRRRGGQRRRAPRRLARPGAAGSCVTHGRRHHRPRAARAPARGSSARSRAAATPPDVHVVVAMGDPALERLAARRPLAPVVALARRPAGCRWPRPATPGRRGDRARSRPAGVPRRRLPRRTRRWSRRTPRPSGDAGRRVWSGPVGLPAAARRRRLGPRHGCARSPPRTRPVPHRRPARWSPAPTPSCSGRCRSPSTAATGQRVGGFCEEYVGYGGEDTDFAPRRSPPAGLCWVGGARPTTSTTRRDPPRCTTWRPSCATRRSSPPLGRWPMQRLARGVRARRPGAPYPRRGLDPGRLKAVAG